MIRRLENGVLDRDHTIVGPFLSIEIYRELLKKRRGKKEEGRKKKKDSLKSAHIFFTFCIFRIPGGWEIFLVGRKDKQSARKGAGRGKGARIDPPASGPIKLNASLPIDKVESRQAL